MHISEAVEEGMPEARFANPLLFATSKNSKLHYMESGAGDRNAQPPPTRL